MTPLGCWAEEEEGGAAALVSRSAEDGGCREVEEEAERTKAEAPRWGRAGIRGGESSGEEEEEEE